MSFASGWRARRFGDSEVGDGPCARTSLGDGDRFYQEAQRAASKRALPLSSCVFDGDRDLRLIVSDSTPCWGGCGLLELG